MQLQYWHFPPYGVRMPDIDFESLGRYHVALDAFHSLKERRGGAMQALRNSIKISSGGIEILRFDGEAARALLDQVIALESEIMECIDALNGYAEKCSKPKVSVRDSRY